MTKTNSCYHEVQILVSRDKPLKIDQVSGKKKNKEGLVGLSDGNGGITIFLQSDQGVLSYKMTIKQKIQGSESRNTANT